MRLAELRRAKAGISGLPRILQTRAKEEIHLERAFCHSNVSEAYLNIITDMKEGTSPFPVTTRGRSVELSTGPSRWTRPASPKESSIGRTDT